MAGERLCETGHPSSATRRRPAACRLPPVIAGLRTADRGLPTATSPRRARRRRLPTRRLPGSVVLRLVLLELLERRREGVLAAGARLHHVVEIADARRPGSRTQRCEAWV